MSIAAMVDNEVAQSAGASGDSPIRFGPTTPGTQATDGATSRAGEIVSSLATYVPAEAIAAYLVLLPFMDPSGTGYTGRWWLAGGIAVLAVLYTIGYRKIAAVKASQKFAMPWIPILTTVFAFAAWVFAIPTSPFNDLAFYTPELGGAVGTIVATGISFVGSVTGQTLTASNAT
jgi:amino acid transporter